MFNDVYSPRDDSGTNISKILVDGWMQEQTGQVLKANVLVEAGSVSTQVWLVHTRFFPGDE